MLIFFSYLCKNRNIIKMRLLKTLRAQNNDNIILVGNKTSDFSAYLKSNEEKSYLKTRFEKDKNQVSLNQYSRQVFIQLIEKKENFTISRKLEELRKAAVHLGKSINKSGMTTVTIIPVEAENAEVLALAEGLILSNYQFLKYFSEKETKKNSLEEIQILSDQISESEIQELSDLCEAVYHARDLVNEPLSYLTAVQLSKEIEKLGEEAGFSVEVLNKKKIESLKMGGLLAVNKGSIDPPTFNILEYKPSNARNSKPYVLVGKGIVYDTGGLSLKPTTDSMDYMKCDMAGAAAVAGSFYAIARAGLDIHIIGLIPATDNRPDGNAYVPGDVIKMYDGTTVEVLNTDAEGRMVLADALSWAKQYQPELVIDLATLTGSAHAAIGTQGMVGMGNAPRKVMDRLIESSYASYERIAEFPFWDEYAEEMKSDIADLKNIGGRLAGSITAGKFLEHFTNYPYIHLDIAGPSFNKKPDSYRGKGGSGVGVRLLFDFFKHLE